MLYSQSPPLAEGETAEQNSSREFAREQEARPDPQFGQRPVSASVYARPPQHRPSIGRRMFRAVTRFAIAVLIGVGATLGWQAYGETAKEMLAAHAPELAWALAYIPATQPVAVAAPANAPLQLEPLASSLDAVRRSVEQIALKQEQMARSIAAMQAVDEDIRQKVSSPPTAAAQPTAAVAPPKPAPPKTQSVTQPVIQPAAAPSSTAPRPSPAPGPLSLAPAR
jgi:hypothetical protein